MIPSAEEGYSVLMAVYRGENPEFFRQSIYSMVNQTLEPSDFVLVCDGPLNSRLEEVIREAEMLLGSRLQCVRLPENKGLGNALREGVPRCKCPVIARMDSDDISRPYRCERQIKVLQRGDYAVVGGSLQEFRENPGDTPKLRVLPEMPEEIAKFSKKRNPFNHPCVMYKKEAVLKSGNYIDFPGFEDYCLWVRMLKRGYKGYNLPEIVLDMRVGNGMYARRGGVNYMKAIINFQKFLRDEKMISTGTFLCNCTVRSLVGLVPSGLREKIYKVFLRKKWQ
ncbi:MAG: glycosyltransferase [Eubacteriales bacterium]|nr:glycosyltransferase [Eubacteriales bacterium]